MALVTYRINWEVSHSAIFLYLVTESKAGGLDCQEHLVPGAGVAGRRLPEVESGALFISSPTAQLCFVQY